jgi:hypothetical protein
MKRLLFTLALLTSLGAAQPGYSQYASYVGVQGSSYAPFGYYGGAPVYGSYMGGYNAGSFGYGYGAMGVYGPPLYNAYAAGFGTFAPNVMSIASPGIGSPEVVIVSRGYGSYVGMPSVTPPLSAAFYGNPIPFVPDSFMGSIESFRPFAVYTRFSPY